jgi:hypothetical protein
MYSMFILVPMGFICFMQIANLFGDPMVTFLVASGTEPMEQLDHGIMGRIWESSNRNNGSDPTG